MRGKGISGNTDSTLRADGKNELPTEKLVELYDSHGIPPEVVKEAVEAGYLPCKVCKPPYYK